MTKVGINGFGRIGRLVFRASMKRDDLEVVAINDLIDVEYMAYMLKYDSVHGRFDGTVDVQDGMLVVNGRKIRVTAEKEPRLINWGAAGVEYVVESTGRFLTKELSQGHIEAVLSMSSCRLPLRMIHLCSSQVSTLRSMSLVRSSSLTLLARPTVSLRS